MKAKVCFAVKQRYITIREKNCLVFFLKEYATTTKMIEKR